jgi:hypothetical protein
MNDFGWRVLWWMLLAVWAASAILGMNHVRAGLITSYGADLTVPAWLYITTRSLDHRERKSWLKKMIGASPELAAGVLFLASALTELSQYYWPKGLFSGVFDIGDVLAYGIGLLACYLLDKRSGQKSAKIPG